MKCPICLVTVNASGLMCPACRTSYDFDCARDGGTLLGSMTWAANRARSTRADAAPSPAVREVELRVFALLADLDLDCGDNSCRFAIRKGGMRTNGGCRCVERPFLPAKLAELVRALRALDAARTTAGTAETDSGSLDQVER